MRPAVLYGMEAIADVKMQEKKMEGAKRRMLRLSIEKNPVRRGRGKSCTRDTKGGKLNEKLRKVRMK